MYKALNIMVKMYHTEHPLCHSERRSCIEQDRSEESANSWVKNIGFCVENIDSSFRYAPFRMTRTNRYAPFRMTRTHQIIN